MPKLVAEGAPSPAAVEPWLIQVRRSGRDELLFSRRMTQPYTVVGRLPKCDVCLSGSSVAPRHFYFQRLGDLVAAIDLSALEVELPSSVPVPTQSRWATRVQSGEPVRVGDYDVAVEFSKSERADSAVDHGPDNSLLEPFPEPPACWELTNVKSEDAVMRRHVRQAVTLIGRSKMCRICIAHASASTIHASLVWTGGTLAVVDLCSRTGVRVNGKKVRYSLLNDGDELAIGNCRGVIRYLATSPAPKAISALNGSLTETLATNAAGPQYSEEFVVALLSQFTAMQQELLEQTHRLMTDVAGRMTELGVAAPKLEGGPATSQNGLDPSDHARTDAATCSGTRPETIAGASESGAEIPASSEVGPHAAMADVHAWLNRRLAGLESNERGRLAQLWNRLTGSD